MRIHCKKIAPSDKLMSEMNLELKKLSSQVSFCEQLKIKDMIIMEIADCFPPLETSAYNTRT